MEGRRSIEEIGPLWDMFREWEELRKDRVSGREYGGIERGSSEEYRESMGLRWMFRREDGIFNMFRRRYCRLREGSNEIAESIDFCKDFIIRYNGFILFFSKHLHSMTKCISSTSVFLIISSKSSNSPHIKSLSPKISILNI